MACFIGLLYLTFGNAYLVCFGSYFPNYQNVEAGALFEFPPSVERIDYDAIVDWWDGDCTMWVWFQMDSSDFDLFEASTLVETFASETESSDTFDYFRSQQNWEKLVYDLVGYGTDSRNIPGSGQWIAIDTSNSDVWEVYIITHINRLD